MKRTEYEQQKQELNQKIMDHIESSNISMNSSDWLIEESDKICDLIDNSSIDEKKELYMNQLKEILGRMDVELNNIFNSVKENKKLEELYLQLENQEIEED